ncbi:MAG: HPF/RaiA family ribosome-associated protein [Candidatus Tectomicrobia bacterium]|nr:HPF/RaiA family ribosome-associated protein [Candidatus Tectomicrobia bacterium]
MARIASRSKAESPRLDAVEITTDTLGGRGGLALCKRYLRGMGILSHPHQPRRQDSRAAVEHLIGERAITLEIELSDAQGARGGEKRTCKVNMTLPRIRPLRVEASDVDILRAVDLCAEKIDRVVKRTKTKRQDQARNPKKQYAARRAQLSAAAEVPAEAGPPELDEAELRRLFEEEAV